MIKSKLTPNLHYLQISVEVTIHVVNTNDNEPEFIGSRSLVLDKNGQCSVTAKDKDGFPVQYGIVSYGFHLFTIVV